MLIDKDFSFENVDRSANEYYQLQMNVHTKKVSRLLAIDRNIDEHIKNISSYTLSFFQKLELCRGLNFAPPQRVSTKDFKAAFDKAYWKLELKLNNEVREVTAPRYNLSHLSTTIKWQ